MSTKVKGGRIVRKIEKLYEGNIRKKYLLFAIPLILSALLSQSYSFINSMMIGKILGSEAFAATAVTAQLIELLSSIFWGYLAGIGIYVSVLFGKNEHKQMLNVIKINLLISLTFSVLVALLCNIFCHQIFDILNVNAEVYKNAEIYFRTYVVGLIIFQFVWGFTFVVNGMGLTKLPLTASIFTGIINVILNYVFLGVMGKSIGYSALASIIANSVSVIFYLFVFTDIFKNMGINIFQKMTVSREQIKISLSYGAPTLFQQMAMYSCTTIVSPLTNKCSTAAISGYAIATKAQTLIAAIYQNSSKANTNFIAQAMGAGAIDKIKKGIRIGISQSLIFFGVIMGLLIIFAKQFTGLFLDPVTDAESFSVSVNIIRFLMPLIIFNVFNNLFHGIFRAIGSGKLLITSTAIYSVCFVIYAYIMFAILPQEIKIYGVHLALGAAYITEVAFATFIFATGKWKTTEYRELEAKQNMVS